MFYAQVNMHVFIIGTEWSGVENIAMRGQAMKQFSRHVRRNSHVYIAIAFTWLLLYGALISLVNSTASRQPQADTEPIDQFVDRTGLCDRMSRGTVRPEEVNDAVEEACRRWTEAQRNYFRLREERVNTFDRKLLIDGAAICSERTYLVVLVHTVHGHVDRRAAIRDTWGGAAVSGRWPRSLYDVTVRSADQNDTTRTVGLESYEVRVAFIFGKLAEDSPAELELRAENERFGDVIEGDFIDSYRNMTIKSLTGLHWASTHCSAARYLFKCDDDMFVNIPGILRAVQSERMERAIMGPINIGSRVYRRGKWALSQREYPFYHYPPYESGSGYVISSDLWRPLLNASDYVPYIFIDDVYITGILGRVIGARHVTRSGFAYWTNKSPDPCHIARGWVLTGTRVSPERQTSLWQQLLLGPKCL